MPHTPITPDLPIAEAGRRMMADELSVIRAFWPQLRLSAEVMAVHEARKAIRRSFTLFKLFAPHFAPDELDEHRAGLRQIMRRLTPCRDIAVFRLKLAAANEAAGRPWDELAAYWDGRQARVDKRLIAYLDKKSTSRIVERYARLATAEGARAASAGDKAAPLLVRHALPGILFQRIGAVWAWGDVLPAATPAQFHGLRIQFKELRYTLGYFEDLLSANAGEIIELCRRIQDHLGDLNDARIAIELLDAMNCCRAEADSYRAFQQAELDRLMAEFRPLFAEFDRPEARRDLAIASVNL